MRTVQPDLALGTRFGLLLGLLGLHSTYDKLTPNITRVGALPADGRRGLATGDWPGRQN
jgi:hypothetical protein